MARPKVEEQRREQILAAFETCVVRQGLDGTSLTDVANEASLPRPLVRYFVGNREDMVELLIARMVTRAETAVAGLRSRGGSSMLAEVVDSLFDHVFADATSNAIVGELWYLARRDDEMRARLEAMYSRAVRELTAELRSDPAVEARRSDVEAVALALLSLAYGETSFRLLGMTRLASKRVRALAHGLAATLLADDQAARR